MLGTGSRAGLRVGGSAGALPVTGGFPILRAAIDLDKLQYRREQRGFLLEQAAMAETRKAREAGTLDVAGGALGAFRRGVVFPGEDGDGRAHPQPLHFGYLPLRHGLQHAEGRLPLGLLVQGETARQPLRGPFRLDQRGSRSAPRPFGQATPVSAAFLGHDRGLATQHDQADALRITDGQIESDQGAEGVSHEVGIADVQAVEDRDQVCGELGSGIGGLVLGAVAAPVTPGIGQDQPEIPLQRIDVAAIAPVLRRAEQAVLENHEGAPLAGQLEVDAGFVADDDGHGCAKDKDAPRPGSGAPQESRDSICSSRSMV